MIVLQERDRRVIRICYEQQFILTEHVERDFGRTSYKNCRKRIRELIGANYLKEDKSAAIGRKPIYRVTGLGATVALENGASPISPKARLQLSTLVHDAIVISVRQRLTQFWDAQFVCERAIKASEHRQIPDGIFAFPSGKEIAIEVENSDKGRSRFISLLSRWRHEKQTILVLYIATSESLFSTIQKRLATAPNEQPFGLVKWDDLRVEKPDVWTPKGPIPLFDRRSF